MDIQARKFTLIEWLVKLQDETVISKIEALQKKARITKYEENLKPMSANELKARAKRANDDIAAGRTLTTEQLEKISASW